MAANQQTALDQRGHRGEAPPEAVRRARRAVVASSVGNALEWFDIIVYSSFAVVISELFFPTVSGFAALMFTFLTFAVSYLVRPLGAAVIGSWADRQRPPDGAVVHDPAHDDRHRASWPSRRPPPSSARWRRGSGCSSPGWSRVLGRGRVRLRDHLPRRERRPTARPSTAAGRSRRRAARCCSPRPSASSLTTSLPHDALYTWGWRVPFLVGMLIGPVGYYIRRQHGRDRGVRPPPRRSLARSPPPSTTHLTRLLTAAGAVALASLSVYLILYMPTFAVKSLGLPAYAGFLGGMIAGRRHPRRHPVHRPARRPRRPGEVMRSPRPPPRRAGLAAVPARRRRADGRRPHRRPGRLRRRSWPPTSDRCPASTPSSSRPTSARRGWPSATTSGSSSSAASPGAIFTAPHRGDGQHDGPERLLRRHRAAVDGHRRHRPGGASVCAERRRRRQRGSTPARTRP